MNWTRPAWLFRVSAAAALAVEAFLLVGLVGLGWSLPLRDNWLVTIYKLLAGFGGDQAGRLHVVNLLDIVILALVGVTLLGLYLPLSRVSRAWSLLAVAMPFLGIPLFVASGSIGRTGVIGATLVISIVMLRSPSFSRQLAWIGVVAGVLLAVGDVTAGPDTPRVISGLFGLGYLLLTVWFVLVARRLFALSFAQADHHSPTK